MSWITPLKLGIKNLLNRCKLSTVKLRAHLDSPLSNTNTQEHKSSAPLLWASIKVMSSTIKTVVQSKKSNTQADKLAVIQVEDRFALMNMSTSQDRKVQPTPQSALLPKTSG